MEDQRFNKTINSFNFHQISKNEDIDIQILKKIDDSKVIVIDTYFDKNNNEYIIVCFNLQLIIIERCHQSIIRTIFSKTNEDKIYFVPKYSNQNHIFKDEIDSFNNAFRINRKYEQSVLKFFKIIQSCMSAYLIKKGYDNSYKDRINDYAKNIEKTRKPNMYSKSEFVSLRHIDRTSTSAIYIRYHIESEKIFITKTYDDEDEKFKLNNRETVNYKSTNFPFFPKFYGQISDKEEKSIIIEYINGQTLDKLIRSKLSFRQKTMIIIEILYIIQYLHRNNFIYRDLKPDNLIVDQNNYVVLIDFDRMIQKDNMEICTGNLNSPFLAPEIEQKNYKPSFENDVYSIGRMILYIYNANSEFQNKYPKTYEIAKRCVDEDLNKRPSMIELIKYFNTSILHITNLSLRKSVEKIISKITLIDIYSCAVDEKDEQSIDLLSRPYFEGEFIFKNINKSLYYLLLSINQKEFYYQFIIGYIYYEEKYVNKDINKLMYYLHAAEKYHPDAKLLLGFLYDDADDRLNTDYKKAFYYYSQASEQNQIDAQVQLGSMYLNGKHVQQNTEKAIEYFQIAAKKKAKTAYLYLFDIYSKGKNVKQDINKALYYLSLGVNEKDSYAQNLLGEVYRDGIYEYITRDINKSIYYFTLSANQKDSKAQVNLGNLYYEGKYVEKDINKAIYYLTLAAEQNNEIAENNLGYIYLMEKNYINVDKGLSYLYRSANKNDPIAQHHLGIIYYYSEYNITRDVKRAVHYFTLSAEQGYPESQELLGEIYYFGDEDVPQDIKKAIHYFTLAANQYDINAQRELGKIYFSGKYVPENIEKSIYYFTLAADHNDSKAQYFLGKIYYNECIYRNIEKSIHYLSLSASQNDPDAQYFLGLIYFKGEYVKREMIKTLKYMEMASENDNIDAQLFLGDLYFEGKYVKRNIEFAIKYYKKASSFNNKYAKNNLGVIYKNGFNFVEPNNNFAKIYFNEAIKQTSDCVSMFNLANILLDEEEQENAIKLLIELAYQEYDISMILLSFIFAKKYKDININTIIYEFSKYKKEYNNVVDFIYLLAHKIQGSYIDEDYFIILRKIDIIYIHGIDCVFQFFEELNDEFIEKQKIKDIDENFYEGLGHDIFQ